MQDSPCEPVESIQLAPEKQSKTEGDKNEDVKTNSAPLKELKKSESVFRTPEKSDHCNEWVANETSENLSVIENSTLLEELRNTETDIRTPEKTSPANQPSASEANRSDTQKKSSSFDENKSKQNSTPLKESKNTETEFKTPEKTSQPRQSVDNKVNETPGKTSFYLKLEQLCDGEDGMISTTEQARLLIAASKTPSKSVNRTPVKQNTPGGKHSVENSPVTPGKHRRVELITLASPKSKRLKQM